MEVPDQLLCLFSAELTERDGSYVLEVPDQERHLGEVEVGQKIRVAILPSAGDSDSREDRATKERGPHEPPVDEGETRVVEIEDLGEQGDGIARVERGFVVIIPDTDRGERVRIEITDVRENVAFGTVVERLSYYE